MSDHAWTQENLAAFVVGGLTAAEVERLEGHARDCPECAAAVAEVRRFDGGLRSLFAPVRPASGLEDRAIGATRSVGRRRVSTRIRVPRLAAVAAGLLVLTTIGALAGSIVGTGRLPLPGYAEAPRVALESDGFVLNAKGSADRGSDTKSRSEVTSLNRFRNMRMPPPTKSPSPVFGAFRGLRGVDGAVMGDLNGTVVSGGRTITGVAKDSMSEVKGVIAGHDEALDGQTPPMWEFKARVARPVAAGAMDFFRPTESRPPALTDSIRPELAQRGDQVAQKPSNQPPGAPEPAAHRVIIRSGEIRVRSRTPSTPRPRSSPNWSAALKGAFVATVNSDKLANGKVRGSITVRTPPEHLDKLVARPAAGDRCRANSRA